MATHADVADRLGREIKSLQAKMDKESDRRLKASYERRISQIKAFLAEKLPADQQAASQMEMDKRVGKAKTYSDFKDIDVEFNQEPGTAFQMQKQGVSASQLMATAQPQTEELPQFTAMYGGEIPQYGYGMVPYGMYGLPQHGFFGKVLNGVGNVVGNVASGVGNAVGGLVSGVGNVAGNIAGGVVGGLGNLIGDNAVGNAIGNLGSGINNVLTNSTDFLGNNISNVGNTAGGIVQGFTGAFGDGEGLFTNIGQGIQGAGNALGQGIQGVDFNPFTAGTQNPFGGGQQQNNMAAQPGAFGGAMQQVVPQVNANHMWGQGAQPQAGASGYKTVHDAFYQYGGNIPYGYNGYGNIGTFAYGGNLPQNKFNLSGVTEALGNVDWKDVGGKALGFLKDNKDLFIQGAQTAGETAPMLYNAMLLNQPSAYMWNPMYNPNEAYMYDIMNQQEADLAAARQLMMTPEYHDPSGQLKELEAGYDMMKDSLDYYSDPAAGMLGQMSMDASLIDDRMDTIAKFYEMNRAANSPMARAQKAQAAAAMYDPIFSKLHGLGADRQQQDLFAWDWNNKVDAARTALGSQMAMDTSEFSQGRRNNAMLGNALNVMGAFTGYDPLKGLTFKGDDTDTETGTGN